MLTIAVLIDWEEGHLLPSFWLSRGMKDYGHKVCYLGYSSSEGLVRRQGFEFISVDKKIDNFGPLVRGEVLDEIIATLRPDIMLVHSLYYIAGLTIHYLYRLP